MRYQHPTRAFKYLILALGLQLTAVNWAHAQSASIFGGTRTVGSSSTSGSRTSSAFGGNSAMGAAGSSSGTSASGGGLSQMGNTGQITGSERYLRSNRTGTFVGSNTQDRGFVGAANSSGANGMGGAGGMTGRSGSSLTGRNSMMGMGGTGGFGGMGGFGGGFGGMGGFNRNNMFGMNNRMGGANQRRVQVRTQLRADFAYAPIAPSRATTNLQARMDRTVRLRTASPLTVALDEQGVVVLRGQVATEDDRQLAVRLAKLEPGVETVRDELTVLAAEASPTNPSAP